MPRATPGHRLGRALAVALLVVAGPAGHGEAHPVRGLDDEVAERMRYLSPSQLSHGGGLLPSPLTAGAGRPDAPSTASQPAPPSAPAAPARPGMLLQAFLPMVLQVVFGPTMSGRTRGHVYDMFGYMPYGDGYGQGVLNADGAKPWWYDYDDSGPQNSQASIGPADFLPTRGPVCPPDCPVEESVDLWEAGQAPPKDS